MKPRFVIAVLLVIALAAPASMLAQQSKAAKEKEVRAVFDEIQKGVLKGGVEAAATLDKYNADDFTLIQGNGSVLTKAETSEGYRSGKTGFQKMDLSDVKVRIYGNTAVVTGIVTYIGEQAGSKSTGIPARFTRVFVKRDGNWKQVLNQSTRITQQ
jgi:ketosteroid isomerase-like protein